MRRSTIAPSAHGRRPFRSTLLSEVARRAGQRPRLTADLKKLLACSNVCSKRWVHEQYDSHGADQHRHGPGGEAGVMRIKGTGNRDQGPEEPSAVSPWRSTATAAGPISIPSSAPCTPSPKPRAKSPAPAQRPSPPPTASTSAIPRSPKSWRSFPPPSTASPKPAPRSARPSPAATCPYITRRAAKASIPRRSSALSAFSKT